MSDTFKATYLGSGCFTRRNMADGRPETIFVKAENRPEWLIEGRQYVLRVERQHGYGVIFHVVELVGELR